MRRAVVALALTLWAAAARAQEDSLQPPAVKREFRGLWVATVTNMDWPSRPGLSTADQQRELLAILDRAAQLRMNAIIFQVRPEADALYASPYEPWSRFLTGVQGQAPQPLWDPLAFAVSEAHKRGLELHAWFNPYRAAYWKDSARARSHVSRQKPWLVVPYDQYLWMDPGRADVRRLTVRAILDVVRRYDIDGVHIDDYFYPYPEPDRSGKPQPFPDDASYALYRRQGGRLPLSDWRRRNVDQLVSELYAAVKGEKMWVKFGISPFGIWRPGYPPTTTAGIDTYEELYADSRKWLREGTLDYIAPQLYWPIEPPAQSYPVLLRWWVGESVKQRHVWPGLAAYKLAVTGPKHMSAEDIVREIALTRETPGATGHILFNARIVMDNVDGIADRLASMYAEPAIMPASPWLDHVFPRRPVVSARTDSSGAVCVRFAPGGHETVWQWVLQGRLNDAWSTTLLPGAERGYIFNAAEAPGWISVSAVDRNGNLSPSVVVSSSGTPRSAASPRIRIEKEPTCRTPD
ncbi:MAG TPA: family 10 glycosylhydrolase [Gemmatimonadaceae bacterium]|nr:family 10 glycosylhydrolase [Gemmatimonadaceae bacterium]